MARTPCRQNFLVLATRLETGGRLLKLPPVTSKIHVKIVTLGFAISCAGFVLCQSDYNRHALFVGNRLSYNYGFSTLEPECCYQALTVRVSVNQGKPASGSGSERPVTAPTPSKQRSQYQPRYNQCRVWQNWILSKTTRTLFPGTKSI